MAAKAKALGVDFQLLDNGTMKATLTVLDAAGLATTWPTGQPIVWTVSDPGVVATPADGLSAILAPASPPVLVTGVIPTATGTLADGTVITVNGDPIDVIAGGAAGFQMAESAS